MWHGNWHGCMCHWMHLPAESVMAGRMMGFAACSLSLPMSRFCADGLPTRGAFKVIKASWRCWPCCQVPVLGMTCFLICICSNIWHRCCGSTSAWIRELCLRNQGYVTGAQAGAPSEVPVHVRMQMRALYIWRTEAVAKCWCMSMFR